MRSVAKMGPLTRTRLRSRAASFVVVVCLSASTAGCSHISAMFDGPEPPQKATAIKKPPPLAKPAPRVSPEQRAEADALRTTALEQVRRGAIGPAVSNLTSAAKLDPENQQIRRDLARATRMRSEAVAPSKADARPRRVALD